MQYYKPILFCSLVAVLACCTVGDSFGRYSESIFQSVSSQDTDSYNMRLGRDEDRFFTLFSEQQEIQERTEPTFTDSTFDVILGQKNRRRGDGGRVWTNLYYGDTTLKPKGLDYKIKPDLYGIQLGFDIINSHGIYTTFFATVNQSKTDIGRFAESTINNYLVGFGKYFYTKGCHFGFSGSLGYDGYKVTERLVDAKATGNGLQMNLFGEFGIDVILGRWAIKPFYALQYEFVYHGRIKQGEDYVFRGDQNAHSVIQLLGTRINWKAFDSFEFQGRLTWVHEMLNNPPPFYNARFSPVAGTSTPAIFFYEGNTGRDWAWIGLGAKFEPIYNIFLFLDYDLMINGRHATHLGSLGLCLGW